LAGASEPLPRSWFARSRQRVGRSARESENEEGLHSRPVAHDEPLVGRPFKRPCPQPPSRSTRSQKNRNTWSDRTKHTHQQPGKEANVRCLSVRLSRIPPTFHQHA